MDVIVAMVVVYTCALVLCFYLKLELTHPAVVHALLWFACSCLAVNYAEESYLPKDYFILIANILFFLCCIMGSQTVAVKKIEKVSFSRSNKIIKLIPFVFIISFYVVLLLNFRISSLLDISAFRDYLVADDGANYGTLGRLAMVSLFSSSFLLLRSKKLFFVSLFTCIPIIIILGAKTLVLLYLVSILILTPNRLRFSKILLFAVLFIFSFFGIMSFRYPDASFNLISYFLYNYICGGFLAFTQLSDVQTTSFGFYSFRNIYLWLNIFYPFDIANMIQDWVYVPFPVNVYTYLRPYYLDFGYFSVVFPMFFGFISGRVYIKKYKNIRTYYILYPIIFYAILMQLVDDQYFTWISNWIFLIIIGYIMTRGRKCLK
ncbi:O-antigen polymerase [Pseudescherichia sp.]|uniref:O-antigen polymerase n=1 Tax=Pseudescherichia sp. TaxID=2055881 RepID=UPI0028A1E3B9|nr:O-antigen polymerase [Pseudescherichia sp.]